MLLLRRKTRSIHSITFARSPKRTSKSNPNACPPARSSLNVSIRRPGSDYCALDASGTRLPLS